LGGEKAAWGGNHVKRLWEKSGSGVLKNKKTGWVDGRQKKGKKQKEDSKPVKLRRGWGGELAVCPVKKK